VPVPRIYRSAAACGLACALILVFNAARRAGLVPSNGLTHAVAPLAETFGLLALIGLYLLHRERSGPAGQAAFVLNFVGLCGVLGAEFIINLIFPTLTKAQEDAFLHGPTGKVFTISAITFLIGAAMFGATMWRFALLPRPASVAYAVGSAVIGLRGVLPGAVYVTGLLIVAAGIAALSIALGRQEVPDMRALRSAPGPGLARS
jgi:hypothetical protein